MKHGLKDKINKTASVTFMTLIAGLLLVAFVPEVTQNLFSYRSDVSNTLAARVNSDPIARSEVTFYIERAYGKLDEAYKTFAESQALRALIQRKLLVQVADQFIIIKCEGHLPAADIQFSEVRPRLAEAFRGKQSRVLASKIFGELQEKATIENILNDTSRGQTPPDVAARVNGHPITIPRVRDACVERYGKDVL